MTVYRASYYTQSDSSEGFGFFATRREADESIDDFEAKNGEDFDTRSGVDDLDFPFTKAGIVALLNQVASEPQNG